ncbi:hypothetical protein LY90DRAFT_13255 [Neocallimastix californiae]|uniref:Uncharacterized protein n=1 Tax=Neocallimastix californiae TaxID=1754190 RepID=A0A1Y2CIM6_9FUNG|nr:hypothetical protein LY90DRAFT_13255 [Neocallimastix californiae]|eukprot:ORY46684.1 hypothetical protein LY90DRAFT_13255 [Neocallimastix californiae]
MLLSSSSSSFSSSSVDSTNVSEYSFFISLSLSLTSSRLPFILCSLKLLSFSLISLLELK